MLKNTKPFSVVKKLIGKMFANLFSRTMLKKKRLSGKYGMLRFIAYYSTDEFKRIKKYNDEWNLREISKKRVIRFAFLVYTSSMWNVDCLYKLLCNDPRFDVDIIVGHLGEKSDEASNREYLSTLQYFKNVGYSVKESNKLINAYDYDIVFSLTPFRLSELNSDYFRYPLSVILLHTSYSYMLSGNMEKIDIWMYHFALRFYTDSEYYKSMVEKSRFYTGNAKYLGFPKMDAYYNADGLRISNKKTIIYAPHHSVTYSQFKSATFEDNYLELLNIARKYSEYTYWIYKPHPLLRGASVEAGIFHSLQEYDAYENSWDGLDNGEVVSSGDYFQIFKGSDAMITDSVSFLAEYQFTNNPLLLLQSGKEQYNEFGDSIVNILYRCLGSDIDAIELFIQNIISGNDEMKGIRQDYFSKNLDYRKDGKSANQLLYEDILNLIK